MEGRPFTARLLLLLLIIAPGRDAIAQYAVGGDRLSGFVLPVEPQDGDIEIRALRAYAWTVDDTKRLVLEHDVHLRVGKYDFDSDRVVVWINRIPSADGLINQIAAYFDDLSTPTSTSGLGAGGRRLLLTASARGAVDLEVALLQREPAPDDALLTRAERRLAGYLETLATTRPILRDMPAIDGPTPSPTFRPRPGGTITDADVALPAAVGIPGSGGPAWLQDPKALIRFGAGRIEIVPGTEENSIRITDKVVVDYSALGGADDLTQLTLSAERAVIFTDPGPLEELSRGELSAQMVRGIYLEGNVTASTNEGDYTVRAPQAYYDFQRGQAILLDSVLRTYSRQIEGPVYARADEMRQVAENQWQAKGVRATTSDFAVGHIALGADKMLVTQRPVEGEDGGSETHIDSVGNTLRIEDLPIMYWPRFSGTMTDIPLRSASVGYEDPNGAEFETTWDLFSLLGRERPDGVDIQIALDGYTKRGAGAGVKVDYDLAIGEGEIDLYGLWDTGTDRTSSGRNVKPDNDFRGVALFDDRTELGKHWIFQGQASYISDDTFITTWREDDFAKRREYETSAYTRYQNGIFATDLLGKYSLNGFISNDYLLASRAYTVDKLPEFTIRNYGLSFWEGAVTYSQETRYSRMKFAFNETDTNELGVRSQAFGIPPTTDINDAFLAAGYPEEWVNRLDSRHEFSAPMQLGIFNVTPFVTGRFTWYDNDFQDFSSDAEDTRVFATAGVSVSTRFQKVDNSAESKLFGIHRVRHIVEPSISLWYGWTNVDAEDLPIFDQRVEPLQDGGIMRLGLRNIWQTQRGGPGRWRSVDFLTVNAALVLDTGGEKVSPTPQYFDYRPEYSQFGDHVFASAVWLPSDGLSIVGEMTYDIEDSTLARGSIGADIQHTPVLSTYIEYRFIDASDNQLLGIGWNYELSPKYVVRIRPQWDFEENDFRAIALTIVRRFPDFDLLLRVSRDEIKDQTSFSASMELAEF